MQQELATDPFVEFRKVAFGSAFYMIIVALIAIVANALLLVVFLVDPLKMLRSPPSYFLIGLAISDLLTALILLPIYSGCFIMMYLQTPQSGLLLCRDVLLHVGLTQGGIALTISYLVVSAFSFTQLVVVSSPLKYGRMISSTKSIICVLVLYLYAILFWLSEFFGASTDLLKKIDVFLHSLFILFLTIIFYTLLHFSFKRKIASSRNLSNDTSVRSEESSQNRIQGQFITVNLILISILIICLLPGLVFWLAVEFWLGKPLTPKMFIVNLMIDDVFENHVGSICLRMALTKISGSSTENFPGAEEMLQKTKIRETPRGISIKALKRIRRDFGDKKDLKRIRTKTYTSQYLVLSRNTNQIVNMTTRQNEQSSQHI